MNEKGMAFDVEKRKYLDLILSMVVDCKLGGISWDTFKANLKIASNSIDKI